MGSTRSFDNVTQAVWDCEKATSIKQHGTVYEPADANQGTATTKTIVGSVVLGFVFDPVANTVTYTINSKPFIVSEDQIWDGVQASVAACIASSSSSSNGSDGSDGGASADGGS